MDHIMFSESHCHVDLKAGDAIKRAEEMGVELILTAGIDMVSSEEAIQTSKKFDVVRACVGIHPWNADTYSSEALTKLRELAESKEVVAISEIGLDFVGRRNREGKFVNEHIDEKVQQQAFKEQLKLAMELGLPVLVHDRVPDQEVLDIIDNVGNMAFGVAIHGFSKDEAYAERCLDAGMLLSIGQRTIFAPENDEFRNVLKWIPIEYMLTETDSGSPEGVISVAEKLAELKGCSKEKVGKATTDNLKKLLSRKL